MKDFLKYILAMIIVFLAITFISFFERVVVVGVFIFLFKLNTWWGDSLGWGWLISLVLFQYHLIDYIVY